MRYIIKRTSEWEGRPHPEAEEVVLGRYKDIRTFEDHEDWFSKFPEDATLEIERGFTKEGHPFIIRDGSHIRFYVMEVPDLVKFVEEVGEIILSPARDEYIGYEELLHLEIYDDYRE